MLPAVSTAILVVVSVRLHVTVQHGLINAAVATLITLERLFPVVVSQMVLKMVLVFSDKNTFRTEKDLFRFNVS